MKNQINLNDPIPRLRLDIQISQINNEGQQTILMNDRDGIAEKPVAVTLQMFQILQALDGKITWIELENIFNEQSGGNNEIVKIIIENIQQIYALNYLETEYFIDRRRELDAEYLNSESRPPVCEGSTYPDDEKELEVFLDDLFNSSNKEKIKPNAKNIIVPHIDYQVGEHARKTYASGYHSIRNTDADLFVIFGTSHYANTDYFMLTKKNYSTPLGISEIDEELLNELNKADNLFTIDDFAHKDEHSIELQVVLLQHYFKNKKFKILPILIGSFHEFFMTGLLPNENEKINDFLYLLDRTIKRLNRKAVYISSVDFSHIGRKFGDDFDAKDKLKEVEINDKNLINSLIDNQHEQFFDKIKIENDKWKVCGTSPIYSMLNLNDNLNGELLEYNQWYEEQTQSAVSFASIAYYKDDKK